MFPSTPGEITDLSNRTLASGGPIAASLRERGVLDFHEACRHVQALPYGRTRGGASTVLEEGRGTCNSKHALLVSLARELGIDEIQLGLGMFELSGEGFPAVARVLSEAAIPCMLEAHCYLVSGGRRVDLTWPSTPTIPHPRFLHESTIDPAELPEGKIRRHRAYLEKWLAERGWSMSLDRAWAIREACIAALSQSS